MPVQAIAVNEPGGSFFPHTFGLAAPEPYDVLVQVSHCGICHSDIHLIDNDWKISKYPLVPGHEIIGTVLAVGSAVTLVSPGIRVGIGWQADSCGTCEWCLSGQEQLCNQSKPTCVGRPGGFAEEVLANERFVFPIPDNLPSETAAPLLCAGITVYSPLVRHLNHPSQVGIIGIGGLGHLAIRFAKALGHEVTAISSSPDKQKEALNLGSSSFLSISNTADLKPHAGSIDFLLCTVSTALDWAPYVNMLRPNGIFCFVGATGGPVTVPTSMLLGRQRSITGSNLGSPQQIRDMFQLASAHGIVAKSELLNWKEADLAIKKVRENKARYRMVLSIG